jgi:SnoaL-like domain
VYILSVAARLPEEVFQSHLRLRAEGAIDEDLSQNYAEDVVLLCEFGVLCGRDAVRKSADRLALQLRDAKFEYLAQFVCREYAFLQWRARSPTVRIDDGADSFVIREGQIVMQSVYYRIVNGTRRDG